jgi:hypothetical protein
MRHVLTAALVVIIACSCNDCRDQPQTPPPVLTCGRLCNSNIECKGDPLQRCAFCAFGSCRGSPPVVPPDDAGVDSRIDSGSK